MPVTNDLVINIATVNGSGSQSSNTMLVKSIFRMGLPVGGKNLFPSNIAGLPTWFSIRANELGFVARKSPNDIVVAMNASTLVKDIQSVRPNGVFIYNSDLKFDTVLLREDVLNIAIPFKTIITKDISSSIKLRKLLTNVAYVGVLAQCLEIDPHAVESVIKDMFRDKVSVIESNLKAFYAGFEYAQSQQLSESFPFKLKAKANNNKNKILIDGNTSAALGLLYGGCSFMAWYPITPSSSVAEGFIHYCKQYRIDEDGGHRYSVIQAEDELSAICMVIGASWAGARAITPTSGPGLSLMAEAAGLSYFAEIPAVIWDVQRVGPSTGLPTRTMQGDLLAAHHLSHGDTKHVVLLPGSPEECYEFGQTCFDLAERLQTLVIVLSDLDLGMNLWMSDEFQVSDRAFDRGKILNADDLNKITQYKRYQDIDGDGIPYRTLPGTHHPQAAYFTRGTGHNEASVYSEDPEVYKKLMDRLNHKFETARNLVPAPVIESVVDSTDKAKFAFIAFGSTDFAMPEARALCNEQGIPTNYLRLRALPLHASVREFILAHDDVFIVEQNRDGQLKDLIVTEWPELGAKLKSILQYDGLPIEPEFIAQKAMHFWHDNELKDRNKGKVLS